MTKPNVEAEHSTVMVSRENRTSEVLLSTAVMQVEDSEGKLHYCKTYWTLGAILHSSRVSSMRNLNFR